MTFLSNLFRSKPAPQKIEPLARRSYPKRSKTGDDTNDDLTLTENPEKQRARHRLIGAATLVLIAVIGLPQILDQQPKPVANDITVQIVSNIPNPAAGILNLDADKKTAPSTKMDAKPDNTVATISPQTATTTPPKTVANPPNNHSSLSSKNLGLAPGEELVSMSKESTPVSEAKASANGKFVIQIGAFASEERANGWIAKLKENKIPHYVLTRNNAEGIKLFVLRAGPFAERDAAEAAEKRIRALGLTPRLVELNKS
jgi:DedD protein